MSKIFTCSNCEYIYEYALEPYTNDEGEKEYLCFECACEKEGVQTIYYEDEELLQ